ncbi:HAD family hydrolase [Alicyclobacillus fodiniaquatilis]|uniref:HAD family hydrolase n=1 Tax=Alicyclobacillus fodiniaquatilis TaxID=1661150 RepID=A0ABW4JGD4_9BACL
MLDTVGIRSYFDSIVLSYKHKIAKPMPDIYLKALKELNGRAEDCFFIGDGGDNEMDGAKQVGLMTILVDHRRRNDVHADFKVNTLSDALHIILEQNRT